MTVHIRLKRVGKKKNALYRIVAIDSRKRRDGRPIEILGNYNPSADNDGLICNKERIQYWISVGAVTSDRVRTTLMKKGEWSSLAAQKKQ